MGTKYVDETWDFRTADTKTHTQCFHSYPAMMIPPVAGRLIDSYGKDAKLLFDPYCGTGTSLVEANLRGIDAIGTDINPLARLIAKAKTTPLDLQELDTYLKSFTDLIFEIRYEFRKIDPTIPDFKNIDYWFSPAVQRELALIKEFIDTIPDENIANFFKVAFSETVRESSWTRNGEFKLFRMSEKQMDRFAPDVFGIMERKLSRNIRGLKSFMDAEVGDASVQICDFNTIDGIPTSILQPETVDIVVTSPPYGDSRTTVAYGQFSRLASQWLGFEEANQVDNLCMGGRRSRPKIKIESDIAENIIAAVASKDEKRAQDVAAFYADYQRSIDNISKVIKYGGHGYVCYVVGNRKVKATTLPTDEITRQLFESNDFTHVETIVRRIPNKTMPSKNSPTNVAGELDTTMNNEYIVVLKR
jgi:tRNA G10  N-methylase Trm11